VTETLPAGTHPKTPPTEKMPGHMLLARLGKKVLRPGGLELTERMLAALAIGPDDDVVEFAPGRGATARLALAGHPRSYVGIEADAAWAARLAETFAGDASVRMEHANAGATGLADATATVVYGEAMLTMQSTEQKARIVSEACRVLRSGGRYGIHELCIVPDGISDDAKAAIRRDLSLSIHVGARPLTEAEWRELFDESGLTIETVEEAPMHLLEPRRVVRDEGLWRSLGIARRALGDRAARKRIQEMRKVFHKHADNLAAVAMVAVKR